MAKMSDLAGDLVREILTKIPLTSLNAVRSTCKTWNALSKTQIFGNTTTTKQFLGFILIDYTICSLRLNIQGIRNDNDFVDLSLKKVRVLDKAEIQIWCVFQCDGLLLCVTEDKLLVWNPYLGETRSIQPTDFNHGDRYALGYDNNHNHKILRVLNDFDEEKSCNKKLLLWFEIYDFRFNSWRVLDFTPSWDTPPYDINVSLKGNTYFLAGKKNTKDGEAESDIEPVLFCFDYTTERFEPCTLPIHLYPDTLACVKDEKLAVLYVHSHNIMEIWIMTKIELNTVSWSKFLEVNITLLNGIPDYCDYGSFIVDEEKRVAMIFHADVYMQDETSCSQTAYIIGQDGYFKSVTIGEAREHDQDRYWDLRGLMSYVPSLVQVQINQPRKRKERE